MFSPKGLFNNLPCPDTTGSTCSRNPCPFSHKPLAQLDLLPSPLSALIFTKPNVVDSASSKTNAAASTSKEGDQGGWTTVTRKRQAAELSSASGQAQPPKKLQRVNSDASKKPIPSKPISTNVCVIYLRTSQSSETLFTVKRCTNPSYQCRYVHVLAVLNSRLILLHQPTHQSQFPSDKPCSPLYTTIFVLFISPFSSSILAYQRLTHLHRKMSCISNPTSTRIETWVRVRV